MGQISLRICLAGALVISACHEPSVPPEKDAVTTDEAAAFLATAIAAKGEGTVTAAALALATAYISKVGGRIECDTAQLSSFHFADNTGDYATDIDAKFEIDCNAPLDIKIQCQLGGFLRSQEFYTSWTELAQLILDKAGTDPLLITQTGSTTTKYLFKYSDGKEIHYDLDLSMNRVLMNDLGDELTGSSAYNLLITKLGSKDVSLSATVYYMGNHQAVFTVDGIRYQSNLVTGEYVRM